jgi:hypothetical protein
MKRYINLVVYIIYRYYKDGGKRQEVAFLTTKLNLGVCLYLNILTVLSIFHIKLPTIISSVNSPGIQYLMTFIFIVLPIYIIMSLLFKEEKIQKLEYSQATKKAASIFVICYVVVSFILFLAIVAIFHKVT